MIGTDFSASATRAAEIAVSLAGDGATIHLVHVQSILDRATVGQALEVVYTAGTTALFQQLEDRLRLPSGASVRTHIRQGDPADTLARIAQELEADLIAMGTHSKDLLDRLTLGSVAEHVLRSAPCSVLVAPSPAPSAPAAQPGAVGTAK